MVLEIVHDHLEQVVLSHRESHLLEGTLVECLGQLHKCQGCQVNVVLVNKVEVDRDQSERYVILCAALKLLEHRLKEASEEISA